MKRDPLMEAMSRRVEAEDKVLAPVVRQLRRDRCVEAWVEDYLIRMRVRPAWVLPRLDSITVRQRIRAC